MAQEKIAVVSPTRLFSPWETYLTIGTIGLCPDGRWLDHTSLTLASILRDKGKSVKYFDGENKLQETFDLANDIVDWRPKWVVITTETVDYERAPQISYDYVNRLVELIKMKDKNIKVIVYGTHLMADRVSITGKADFCIPGEPEHTVPNIIDGATLETIKDGDAYLTQNLDSLPFPAVDLVENVDGKCSEYASGLQGKFIQLAISRGCPHACGFCFRSTGNKIRRMSPKRVGELIDYLKEQGFVSFFFIDDDFGGGDDKHEWAKEICKVLIPKNIKWSCQTRSDVARDKELTRLMKASGCETVGFGLESYNENILNKNGKGQHLEDIDAAEESLREAGLKQIMFWVLGLVGETEHTINSTVNYILRKKPYGAGCLLAVPYPMSPMSKCKQGFVYDAYLRAGMVGNHVFKDLFTARTRWKEIDAQVGDPYNLIGQVAKYRPNVYERYLVAVDLLKKQGKNV